MPTLQNPATIQTSSSSFLVDPKEQADLKLYHISETLNEP